MSHSHHSTTLPYTTLFRSDVAEHGVPVGKRGSSEGSVREVLTEGAGQVPQLLELGLACGLVVEATGSVREASQQVAFARATATEYEDEIRTCALDGLGKRGPFSISVEQIVRPFKRVIAVRHTESIPRPSR